MLNPTASFHRWSISTAQVRHRKFSPQFTGLAIPSFDDDFDLFFEVKSDFLDKALAGEVPQEHIAKRCERIPEFSRSPQHWGLPVDTLHLFWQYVRPDAQGYAAAHHVDGKFRHVCLSSPCEWHHHDPINVISEAKAEGKLTAMSVNMHLITSRYIKPWTSKFPDAKAGLALVMNTARLCDRPGPLAEEICKASIFISHYWDELSTAFFGTLERDFDEERIVWVCSFALDQNGRISDDLKHIETTPFYRALQGADSITAITDASCEVFDRVWCVLEAHLALEMAKPFNMLLWEDDNHQAWHEAAGKLSNIDVHQCRATVQADKDLILAYCDQHLEEVNRHLREISTGAVFQAELRSFAKEGNLIELFKRKDLVELREWKTGKRHRTLTHLFAVYSHVAEMLEFSEKINHKQLDTVDIDSRTPLSLACEVGEVATVNALVTLRADVDMASHHGLTPLHYAAECGHRAVVHILKKAGADIYALGTFKGEKEHSPMSVAVTRDAPEIVRDFLDWGCDGNFSVEGMPVLHRASQWGYTRTVAALVASKSNVNGRTSEGRTALMQAAMNGHASVVSVLRSIDADTTLIDSDGLTVKDCVDECRHDHPLEADDIEFFLQAGPTYAPSRRMSSSENRSAECTTLKMLRKHDCERGGRQESDATDPFGDEQADARVTQVSPPKIPRSNTLPIVRAHAVSPRSCSSFDTRMHLLSQSLKPFPTLTKKAIVMNPCGHESPRMGSFQPISNVLHPSGYKSPRMGMVQSISTVVNPGGQSPRMASVQSISPSRDVSPRMGRIQPISNVVNPSSIESPRIDTVQQISKTGAAAPLSFRHSVQHNPEVASLKRFCSVNVPPLMVSTAQSAAIYMGAQVKSARFPASR